MKRGWREKEVDGVMKGWWAEGGQLRRLINT